jgi:predicted SprT family Zn-dependent metalloprotease
MNIHPNAYNLANRIEHALAIFKERNPILAERMSWHDVEVKMSHRLRRAAGRCMFFRKLDKFRVEFSESMFAGMTEQEKTGTVQHELAHVVAFRLNAGENHDGNWKRLCYDMGGDGERLLRTKAEVQKNVVKRVVLADKANAYSLMIRTKMQAERLTCVRPEVVRLGSIAINYNDKTYRWASVINQDVLTIKVLKESLGWKLVG